MADSPETRTHQKADNFAFKPSNHPDMNYNLKRFVHKPDSDALRDSDAEALRDADSMALREASSSDLRESDSESLRLLN
jgi:hypothetical protein